MLIVVFFIGIIIGIALLYILNLPKESRFIQLWTPVVLVLLNILLIVLGPALDADWNRQLLAENVITRFSPDFPLHIYSRLLVYNFLIFTAFLLLKFVVHGLGYGISLVLKVLKINFKLHQFIAHRKRKAVKAQELNIQLQEGVALAPGYRYLPMDQIVKSFDTAPAIASFLLKLAVVPLLYFFILLIGVQFIQQNFLPPMFPLPIALLLIEIAWYLQGGSKKQARHTTEDGQQLDPKLIWQDPHHYWKEHLIFAVSHQENLASSFVQDIPSTLPEKNESAIDVFPQKLIQSVKTAYPVLNDPEKKYEAKIIEHIARGDYEGLLFLNAVKENIRQIFYTVFYNTVLRNQRLLVIAEEGKIQEQLKSWLEGVVTPLVGDEQNSQILWQIDTYETFQEKHTAPNVLIASYNQIVGDRSLDKRPKWYSAVGAMLFFELRSNVLLNPIAVRTLLMQLKRLNTLADQSSFAEENESGGALKVYLISESREFSRPTIEQNLQIKIGPENEFRFSHKPPQEIYLNLWRAEGVSWFQETAFQGQISEYLGIEPLLSLSAAKYGAHQLLLIQNWNHPWKQYQKSIEKRRRNLSPQFATIPGEKEPQLNRIQVVIHDTPPEPHDDVWDIDWQSERSLFIRDESYNWIQTAQRYEGAEGRFSVINIVSQPYLLREYMVAFYRFFMKSPIAPFAPKVKSTSVITLFYTLVNGLTLGQIEASTIENELSRVYPQYSDKITTKDKLHKLLSEVLDEEEDKITEYIKQRQEYDFIQPSKGESYEFVLSTYYYLLKSILENHDLEWMQKYQITYQNRTISTVPYDHLYQTYLPGQVFAKDGTLYRVNRIVTNPSVRCVEVDQESTTKELFYRKNLSVLIEKLDETENQSPLTVAGFHIHRLISTNPIEIHTLGLLEFRNDLSLLPNGENSYRYQSFTSETVPPRVYKHGRVLTFLVKARDASPIESADKISFTLSVLLNELLPSFFPGSHHLVCAVAPPLQASQRTVQALDLLYPTNNSKWKADEGTVQVQLVEDSNMDIGVVFSLQEDTNWELLLAYLQDYLRWIVWEKGQSGGTKKSAAIVDVPVQRGSFLTYCLGDFPEDLALEETLALLDKIYPENHITRNRRKEYSLGDDENFSATQNSAPESSEESAESENQDSEAKPEEIKEDG